MPLRVLAVMLCIQVALPAEWERVRHEEDIVVDRIVLPDSPVVVFRGRTKMRAHLAQLMAVVLDPRTQKEWNNTGYDMRILAKNSDTDLWFYSALRAPWPFRDRDFVIKLETQFAPVSKTVTITGHETEHPLAPRHARRVRMPVSRVNWEFRALTGHETDVTVTFQIDAGGALPLWLMNKVTKGMPFRGLRNIRQLIAEKGYDSEFERRFMRYNGWHGR